MRFVGRDEIVAVSGASMGTMLAYAISANKLEVLEQMYRRVDISKKFELLHEVFLRGLLRKTLGEFVSLDDELGIPMVFPVCRVPLFSVRYFWLKEHFNPGWERYLRAAMNFPFLCIFPEILGHRFAIDGGAADNIPLFPLLKQRKLLLGDDGEFDLILVLHFDARYDYRKDFETEIPILDLDLGICNAFKKNHYDFSSEYVDEMISHAEVYGMDICRELFSGQCTKEELQKKVNTIFLREHTARQKNFSADHFISILNTLGSLLRSDRSCNEFLY